MIVIVRHGRTDANASGLLLGHADPPLDREGERQAAALAGVIATLDVHRIVTSPLTRCRATADIVAADIPPRVDDNDEPGSGGDGRSVAVEVDERWIELDYGELDQLPLAELPAETWASWRADPAWCPPGGESLVDLGARVRAACADLAADAAERDVVVVTHVSPIKAAVAWALGVGDEVAWRMWVAPASITRLGVRRDGTPSLRGFNELAHLA